MTKNPEGFTKEQIKQINKDTKKQQTEAKLRDNEEKMKKFLNEKLKEKQMNPIEAMFGTRITELKRPGLDLSKIKKNAKKTKSN
jgi:hypothetical protein